VYHSKIHIKHYKERERAREQTFISATLLLEPAAVVINSRDSQIVVSLQTSYQELIKLQMAQPGSIIKHNAG